MAWQDREMCLFVVLTPLLTLLEWKVKGRVRKIVATELGLGYRYHLDTYTSGQQAEATVRDYLLLF